MIPGLELVKNFISSIRKWTSPWYAAYAILGLVSAAIIPVLLPLKVIASSHNLAYVAWVMGIYNLGLLTSPIWGNLTDKKHKHRLLFFGGFVLLLAGLIVLPFAKTLFSWLIISFLLGTGTASVATVSTLFVVEFNPQNEWSARIGWLQSFNGAGQTIGLIIAAIFSSSGLFNDGIWIGAALLLPAILLGHLGLPVKKSQTGIQRMIKDLDFRKLAKFGKIELIGGGLIRHSHHLNLSALRNIKKLISTSFGFFILSWFISSFGVAAFFAYFPLAMKTAFLVPPGLTSLIYAVAGGIGIALYTGSTKLSEHYGVSKVYKWGILLRLFGFATMLFLIFFKISMMPLIASLAFAVIILSWPILSVTGTTITAELTPVSEGEAMGLYNASGAVATVLGTFLGGPLVGIMGFSAIPILGVAGLGLSLLLTVKIHMKTNSTEADPGLTVNT
jgi:MFS family permease